MFHVFETGIEVTYHIIPPRYQIPFSWVSKKSPTGPTERTPKKPEYLIVRSQLTERGPLVRSHSIFDVFFCDYALVN